MQAPSDGAGAEGVQPVGSMSLLVPNNRSSRLIGKAGAGLKQIREASHMKVEAKPEYVEGAPPGTEPTACRLVMPGSFEQIQVAFTVALKRVYPDEPEPIQVSLRIPSDWAGRAIGKGAENLKKTRSFGVVSQVERDKLTNPTTGAEERKLTLEGLPDRLPQALAVLLGLSDGPLPGTIQAMPPIVVTPPMPGNSGSAVRRVGTAPGGGGGPAGGGGGGGAGGGGAGHMKGGNATSSSNGKGGVNPGANANANGSDALAGASEGDLGWVPSSPDEVCLHLMVANSMAGVVLGRGGARIKETSQQAGCKVRMTARPEGVPAIANATTPRRVIIVGTLEAAERAQRILNDQLREAYISEGYEDPTGFAITMMLRAEACGAIIGRQGAGIRQVREVTGVKISLQQQSENLSVRPCQLDGTLDSVLSAQKMIHEAQMTVPMSDRPGTSDTLLDDTRRGNQSNAGGNLQIRGSGNNFLAPLEAMKDKGRMSNMDAGDDFEDGENDFRLLVPDQAAGSVIGKQGANLKAIRESLGASVEVKKAEEIPYWPDDRVVVFKGSAEAKAAAVAQVLSHNIFRHPAQAGHGTATLKVLVPSDKIQQLVGEGGRSFRWIQDAYQVQPFVESQQVDGMHLFTAQGPQGQCIEAAKHVVRLLETPRDKPEPRQQAVQQLAPEPQLAQPQYSSSNFVPQPTMALNHHHHNVNLEQPMPMPTPILQHPLGGMMDHRPIFPALANMATGGGLGDAFPLNLLGAGNFPNAPLYGGPTPQVAPIPDLALAAEAVAVAAAQVAVALAAVLVAGDAAEAAVEVAVAAAVVVVADALAAVGMGFTLRRVDVADDDDAISHRAAAMPPRCVMGGRVK
eukprot:CAMPEP_0206504480 /NCGR_PEP_ID=MMETSP0324_2-20121206/55519_1 /ASSEMBLY_ACC=CAM_ASM_000836 /TAXON_ID=2866 /ORGANISM="Crypthecodinium cohnii, Strain Seligo" /LENGTH=853 /DNA_ID=CAMNT_0053993675 /DNA_START=60 /DNA_END=2623 /DNA_ORIENTATION=+